ncbi:MAG: epoxyqueuosine reductase QueH, partial [Christensenella sp.]
QYFATTLTLSPHKPAAVINEIGERISRAVGVAYLASDFKKRGGYQRSIELSREFSLYRQNYCGCKYSRR